MPRLVRSQLTYTCATPSSQERPPYSRQGISSLRLAQPRKVSDSLKSRRKPRYFVRLAQLEKDYLGLRNTQRCKLLFSLKPVALPALPHYSCTYIFRSSLKVFCMKYTNHGHQQGLRYPLPPHPATGAKFRDSQNPRSSIRGQTSL